MVEVHTITARTSRESAGESIVKNHGAVHEISKDALNLVKGKVEGMVEVHTITARTSRESAGESIVKNHGAVHEISKDALNLVKGKVEGMVEVHTITARTSRKSPAESVVKKHLMKSLTQRARGRQLQEKEHQQHKDHQEIPQSVSSPIINDQEEQVKETGLDKDVHKRKLIIGLETEKKNKEEKEGSDESHPCISQSISNDSNKQKEDHMRWAATEYSNITTRRLQMNAFERETKRHSQEVLRQQRELTIMAKKEKKDSEDKLRHQQMKNVRRNRRRRLRISHRDKMKLKSMMKPCVNQRNKTCNKIGRAKVSKVKKANDQHHIFPSHRDIIIESSDTEFQESEDIEYTGSNISNKENDTKGT
jgi:hypothetical protein